MSELEKLLEENKNEILDIISKELDLPKEMIKAIKKDDFRKKVFDLPEPEPYCPVIDFTQRFKELDKPVFEDDCYIRIEIESEN